MAQGAICISGKEAVKLFYDTQKFERQNALPKRIQKTLTGQNSIQTLDGNQHLHRKRMFLSLLSPENQNHLISIISEQLDHAARNWQTQKRINLYDEAKQILCHAACSWAGVPLNQQELKQRADDLSKMVISFGSIGPLYFKGKIARGRTEDWAKQIIQNVRRGIIRPPKDSPLYKIACHINENGDLLDLQTAAVELINILRPIVAIAVYIVFMALALHDNPECRAKLKTNQNNYLEMFVQEVRRYYPFSPFLGARVKQDFIWNNCYFKKGTLVLLDIYGLNHDPRIWDKPYLFKPERFKSWDKNPFSFIPQGGGNPATGHRCPGKGVVVGTMKLFLNFLVNRIDYTVPEQGLSYGLTKIPTLPASGFIMENVRVKL